MTRKCPLRSFWDTRASSREISKKYARVRMTQRTTLSLFHLLRPQVVFNRLSRREKECFSVAQDKESEKHYTWDLTCLPALGNGSYKYCCPAWDLMPATPSGPLIQENKKLNRKWSRIKVSRFSVWLLTHQMPDGAQIPFPWATFKTTFWPSFDESFMIRSLRQTAAAVQGSRTIIQVSHKVREPVNRPSFSLSLFFRPIHPVAPVQPYKGKKETLDRLIATGGNLNSSETITWKWKLIVFGSQNEISFYNKLCRLVMLGP